ncbi:MAG: hypothetical protein WC254_01660 [Candidatus Woesearchaeota archaeon]|jgi:hypothetical protein
MNCKKSYALFMIFLMLSLPIFSASAFAATTVSINSYAGRDGVNGYISEYDDTLNVEAEIILDTSTDSFTNFTQGNVYAEVFGKKEVFDSCEQSGSSYTCYYNSASADRTAAEKSLLVSVYDDDKAIVATEEETVYIDGESPTINKASYPSYFTDDVTISLELEDEACTSCSSACSGIDRVELFFAEEVKENLTIDTSDCEYDTTLETSVSELGLTEGEQQMCIYVYDNVQNSVKKCSTITVDTEAPSIPSNSFVIKDDSGNAIEHTSGAPIHATVQVNITDVVTGLKTETVYANLSAFNSVIGADYNLMTGDCSEYENSVYICSWDVYIETSEITPSVKIYAEDNAGNIGGLTKTISFVEDTTVPAVLSLTSAYGDYFNAKNNTLTLEVQEEGSGFDDVNVYINLAELLLGSPHAESCAQSGTVWYCYWSFAVPSSVAHGESIDVTIASLKDDAGNSYDSTTFEEQTFIYDEEAPVFLNATMIAVGREADVITEGDIVSIEAYLEEDVSGLDTANVYADYSDFDDTNDMQSAQSCVEVNEDIWLCTWEYTGALTSGDSVELNFVATDNAGNFKDSEDDNVVAEKFVVGFVEGQVDYWDEYANVEDMPMLNPNFLYFTSSGTIVRVDAELISKGTMPYIHAYQINACQAGLWMPTNMSAMEWYEAGIVGQYYTEDNRQSKYILVNIPSFFYGKVNATVPEDSIVQIFCTASITQARSEYSNIYSPNEEVNITIEIPLMTGLYTEPSLASVDKIQKYEKLINGLEKITKFLGTWTDWGMKICGPANTVRVLANNLVTMLKSVDVLTHGEVTSAVAATVQVTNFLDRMWYGYYAKEDVFAEKNSDGVDVTEIADTDKMEYNFHSEQGKIFSNKYKELSLGFVCDTVLCESCTESWNKLIFSSKKEKAQPTGGYVGGTYVPDWLSIRQIPVNPRENFVVALICWPPCIPGIYSQLNIYKEILIAYNTCLNVATIKGEDVSQCDQFLSAQICQNVVNALFWNWFWALKDRVVSSMVFSAVEKIKEKFVECPPTGDSTSNPAMINCDVWRGGMAFVTLGTTIWDTKEILVGIFGENGMFGNQTAEEQQTALEEEVDADIETQLGTTPTYG